MSTWPPALTTAAESSCALSISWMPESRGMSHPGCPASSFHSGDSAVVSLFCGHTGSMGGFWSQGQASVRFLAESPAVWASWVAGRTVQNRTSVTKATLSGPVQAGEGACWGPQITAQD